MLELDIWQQQKYLLYISVKQILNIIRKKFCVTFNVQLRYLST